MEEFWYNHILPDNEFQNTGEKNNPPPPKQFPNPTQQQFLLQPLEIETSTTNEHSLTRMTNHLDFPPPFHDDLDSSGCWLGESLSNFETKLSVDFPPPCSSIPDPPLCSTTMMNEVGVGNILDFGQISQSLSITNVAIVPVTISDGEAPQGKTKESVRKKASNKKAHHKRSVDDIGDGKQSSSTGLQSTWKKQKPNANQTQPNNILQKVHNDIYVQFDQPNDQPFTIKLKIHWSSKPTTNISPHATILFTFQPNSSETNYRLKVLQCEELVPILKERSLLPKKPSKPKQDSEGGIYYIQIDEINQVNQDNSQLFQLHSKYNQKKDIFDNTISINKTTHSVKWTKQSNYRNKSNCSPTYQIW